MGHGSPPALAGPDGCGGRAGFRQPGAPEQQASPQAQAALLARSMDCSLVWEDLAWLRSLWRGPLLLKGVLHPEDARRAAGLGVDGVIVSNHGGRQLDAAPSAIRMLPRLRAAAGQGMPLFVDGGFRRGADIARALASGADGVFVGRPMAYGLAVGGQAGVQQVLNLLAAELARTMTLMGVVRPGEFGAIHLCNRDFDSRGSHG
ncbi:nitronate monooxygenase family protein [Bordetella holmesii 41130]|nr:nitronate monooxygenase family protein [Bordetella holmesii 41130]